MHGPIRPFAALLAVALTTPGSALAAWPTDPGINLPVCTAPKAQVDPQVVSDGAGGTIVCWDDGRNDTAEVYVQRIDAGGTPRWAPDGIRACDGFGYESMARPVADGAGGVVLGWLDSRNGYSSDVYAQRIGPDGTRLWGAAGAAVTGIAGGKGSLAVVSDGAGGAVFVWYDFRNGGYRQYAQRLDAAGHAMWTANGVPVTTRLAGGNGMAVADGSGGVITTWADSHTLTWDVYAQRIDGAGALRWGADGEAVCVQPQEKWRPAVACDFAGGAIVAWSDMRLGYNNAQIYAQRLDSTGAGLWGGGGVPFAPTGSFQVADTLLGDGRGGVFAVWQDQRHGPAALFGQHLDAAGAPQWTTVGVAVDSGADVPLYPALALDGSGGLLVAWGSSVYPDLDVRAQAISAAGARRWNDAGVPVSDAPRMQGWPAVAGDGVGGLVAAWWDARNDSIYGDVYAQHIGFDGTPGSLGVPPRAAPAGLALAAPWPSPARAGETIALRYELPVAARVRLTLLDLAGRSVRVLEDAPRDPGAQRASWDGRDAAGRPVTPGLYFVRLQAAGRTAVARVVIAP